MNTFDEPSTMVEPQPVVSPARAACLPPTMTFELPEVMALPAGHGAYPFWSAASAGPAATIKTAARTQRFISALFRAREAAAQERLARLGRRPSRRPA
jgi:hypothetical protein